MFVDGVGDLPIFPCRRDKKPLVKAWQKVAKRIEPPRHWPIVGVLTGAASGFDILDIECEGLTWLEANPLPVTRVHRTPRGFHYFFKAALGLTGSADTRIAKGVHVRSNGNYICWWPRQRFEVVDAQMVAQWPEEILRLARGKPRHAHTMLPTRAALVTNSSSNSNDNQVPKPLYLAIIRLMSASPLKDRRRVRGALSELVRLRDGRNTGLFRAGICFRTLIAEGVLGEAAAVELLTLASALNGYATKAGAEAVEKTVRSALNSLPREQHVGGCDVWLEQGAI